jgi:tetratricopeptide (TPR) repeat protein
MKHFRLVACVLAALVAVALAANGQVFLIGLQHLDLNDQATLEEIRKINPAYTNAHTNLANLLDEQGKTDEAISHYRETIRLRPDDVLARLNLAVALARTARVDEAIIELHAEIMLAFVLADLVDGNDIRMVQLGRCFRFGAKALDEIPGGE